jgi:hypothetical protein
MIRPFDSSCVPRGAECYHVVAWDGTLPAFDPLPMLKTVLLSRKAVKVFNKVAILVSPCLVFLVFAGMMVRIAAFASPTSAGRVLALVSIALQLPGMIITTAHFRIEYVKLLLRTFDFWFLQTANTLWAVTFSFVLSDSRVLLVALCWVDGTLWLLQEAYLHNSYLVVGTALCQWVFYAGLTASLSLDLVDGVHHYALLTAAGRTLSTQDILANVLGTMTMLSLRNLYGRYQHLRHQKSKPGTAMEALGYRCKISLSTSGPSALAVYDSFSLQAAKGMIRSSSRLANAAATKRPLMQMHLCSESTHFDPKDTVWPRVGASTPLATWRIAGLYVCGALGGSCAAASTLLSTTTHGSDVLAVSGLVASSVFSGVHLCCCQRQLLRRVLSSFHFLFLELQLICTGFCVADLFGWRWVSTCGVVSSLLLGNAVLIADALTPVMKQRLQFKHWLAINGVAAFVLIHVLILVDALVWGAWQLQDRVLLEFSILGRRSTFHVVPFLMSRIVTIVIWAGRNAYVSLTRPDDTALILLRGNVEFDYEGWKRQVNLTRG